MRTPIPIENIVFKELSSVVKKVSTPKISVPQAQVSAPVVPASAPKLNSGTTAPITMNQFFIGLAVLALVGLLIYLKYERDQSKKNSSTDPGI